MSQTRELVLPKPHVLARLRLVAKVPKGSPSLGSVHRPLLPVCTLDIGTIHLGATLLVSIVILQEMISVLPRKYQRPQT